MPSTDPDASGTGGFDPEDTIVDPSLTNEAAAISEAPPKLGDDLEIEDDSHASKGRSKAGTMAGSGAGKKAAAAEPAKVAMYGSTPIVVKKSGLFGMGRQNEMILFGGLTVLAFIMVVHAMIVQTPWYIGLSVVLVPIALWKFLPAYKRWRGNRSFKRAWAESFGAGADDETPQS
ncbi:MAG: hypothetical protein ACKVZJ_03840 [Phycisphaerales bacterium]